MDPTFWRALLQQARTCEALGRYEDAIRAREAAEPAFGIGVTAADAAALRGLLQRGGPQGYLRERLRILRKQPGAPNFFVAYVHAQLGDRDAALAELERSRATRDIVIPLLRVIREFDPIRDDPRFDELVCRIGIPEG